MGIVRARASAVQYQERHLTASSAAGPRSHAVRLRRVVGHLRTSPAAASAHSITPPRSTAAFTTSARTEDDGDNNNNSDMYGRVDNSARDQFGRIALPDCVLPSSVTDHHRTTYIERGWVCIEALLSAPQLERTRAAFENQLIVEGSNAGCELAQTLPDPSNPGVRRLCNMMSKHAEFLALATHEVPIQANIYEHYLLSVSM